MKILIIDDEVGIRETLHDILEFNGHEVIAAEDGRQGLQAAFARPDFIFCDVSMPNLDGLGVLAAIREMPSLRDVPFVFLTGNATREDQRAGMTLGADDYITKPFTVHDILNAIASRTRRQLGAREQIQQLTEHHRREIKAHWSHELLTPLNAVIGSLGLLEDEAGTMSPAELKEILALIREGAERQERLARKLIRYFGLEQMRHGELPFQPARSAADTAIHAGAARAAQETNRAASLVISTAPANVAVGDVLLRDAVYELILNALTFSPAGSPVTVTGVVQDGGYRLEISDQGPGLTAEQRAQIGAFIQFDRKKREQQGLGLGLAIAQTTVNLAQGTFALEAGSGGVGLQAILTLPLAPA